MAKAMLIIDMPSCCRNCPCDALHPVIGETHCCILLASIHDVLECTDGYESERHPSCPLREVPQKQDICGRYDAEYFKQGGKSPSFKIGYNDCIDEILGGGE